MVPITVTILQSATTDLAGESRNLAASSVSITKTVSQSLIQATIVQAAGSTPIPSTVEHLITQTVYQPLVQTTTIEPAENTPTVPTSIILITKTKHRPLIQEVTSTVTRNSHVTHHPEIVTLTIGTNMTEVPDTQPYNCTKAKTKANWSSRSKLVGEP